MITPCIKFCKVDPKTQICQGCQRTLNEIANWVHYTDSQRQKIMDQLKLRQ
jgi:predicted Fe-S protein YdhL (DUF1289 family)